MLRTVADQFAGILAAAGTKCAHDFAADNSNARRDAIRRQGIVGSLHVRHEDVAA